MPSLICLLKQFSALVSSYKTMMVHSDLTGWHPHFKRLPKSWRSTITPLPSLCYKCNIKNDPNGFKVQLQWHHFNIILGCRAGIWGVFMFFPVYASVSAGDSSFLPDFRNMHVGLSGDCKVPLVWMCIYVVICLTFFQMRQISRRKQLLRRPQVVL